MLVTLIAVVLPLSLPVGIQDRLTTGAINLVIGLAVAGILTGLARSTVRLEPHRPRENYTETLPWQDPSD